MLLTAPFGSLTHFSPYHFSTGFNKYWYEKCLSDHDFQIEIMEANGGYFDYLRQEVLRIPSVAKTYLAGTSIFCKAACIILAAFLERMTKKDKNSGELLTFGYMVRAVKN